MRYPSFFVILLKLSLCYSITSLYSFTRFIILKIHIGQPPIIIHYWLYFLVQFLLSCNHFGWVLMTKLIYYVEFVPDDGIMRSSDLCAVLVTGAEGWTFSYTCALCIWICYYIAHCYCEGGWPHILWRSSR